MSAKPPRPWPQSQQSVLDGLALAAVTLLSAMPFISRLGFYSDDWGIVESLHAAAAQDRWPWAEILHIFPARPAHGLYSALLYGTFGLDPTGYHVAAAVLLAGSVVLFYLLLVRLGFGRQLALASGFIFVVLSQLSTIRAWFSAGGVALSLALMLASLHGQLSFARTRKWVWGALALLAAVLSLAAYESSVPCSRGSPWRSRLKARAGAKLATGEAFTSPHRVSLRLQQLRLCSSWQ